MCGAGYRESPEDSQGPSFRGRYPRQDRHGHVSRHEVSRHPHSGESPLSSSRFGHAAEDDTSLETFDLEAPVTLALSIIFLIVESLCVS